MVSGGTYGTEEIIHGAGYRHGISILLLLPVLWCLPTAFMIGELSGALPVEGGYYGWVRRGLGNFWGFQEAWLSLAASIFDMAIYPTLFVFYLKQMSPWFGAANHGIYAGLFVVVTCAAESGGDSRSRNYFAVAVLLVVGAVRADRGDGAIQNGSADGSACRAGHRGIGVARRGAGGHVELHGLG
jgi:amino acid transporter